MTQRLPTLPRTRGDCIDGPRPCAYALCRYHLAASPTDSCALDVADGGESSCDEVGAHLGESAQRVHQIERMALAKLRAARTRLGLARSDCYD